MQLPVTFWNLVGTRVFEECFGITVVEEIESAYFVRTVVATVSSSDTAVVNHVVKAFVAVNRRGDWADRLARSVLTVMASDRLVNNLNLIRDRLCFVVVRKSIGVFDVEIVAIVAIDSHPMHLSPAPNIVFTNNWNVVLRLASDNT